VEEQWDSCFDQCDASQRLHFHALDGKRDWLLHWISESNLDYDAWTYHRNGGFYSLMRIALVLGRWWGWCEGVADSATANAISSNLTS
jgi:hypothetical protein